jgi:hypothetical protein
MKRKSSQVTLIALGIIAAGLVGWAVYAKYSQPKVTATKPSTSTLPVSATGTNQTTTPASSQPSNAASSTITPAAPTDAPTESTDNGTEAGSPLHPTDTATTRCSYHPGYSCRIRFVSQNGSTTKYLSGKVVPASGTVSWSWTPNSAGISQGAWTVTALATVNGKEIASNSEVVYVHN